MAYQGFHHISLLKSVSLYPITVEDSLNRPILTVHWKKVANAQYLANCRDAHCRQSTLHTLETAYKKLHNLLPLYLGNQFKIAPLHRNRPTYPSPPFPFITLLLNNIRYVL